MWVLWKEANRQAGLEQGLIKVTGLLPESWVDAGSKPQGRMLLGRCVRGEATAGLYSRGSLRARQVMKVWLPVNSAKTKQSNDSSAITEWGKV